MTDGEAPRRITLQDARAAFEARRYRDARLTLERHLERNPDDAEAERLLRDARIGEACRRADRRTRRGARRPPCSRRRRGRPSA